MLLIGLENAIALIPLKKRICLCFSTLYRNIKRPLFQLYGKAVSFYHNFEPHQASTLDFVGSARCTLPLRRQRVHTFIRFG